MKIKTFKTSKELSEEVQATLAEERGFRYYLDDDKYTTTWCNVHPQEYYRQMRDWKHQEFNKVKPGLGDDYLIAVAKQEIKDLTAPESTPKEQK